VKVEMPEPVDVLVLVAAHLALVETLLRTAFTFGGFAADLSPPQ